MAESDTHSRTQLRRAVLSSYLGSVIEYYDFLLYATASAVVFAKVFFSTSTRWSGTVASFGTLATGYLARPLGGILFGHFGDRLGRKKMLVTTMTLMGVVSVLIGVLPTYAQIGVWAPILLVLLRVLQGFAVGGEWGGAVLMSAEHATSRRGLWARFTNAGAPSGMVLSTVALAGAARSPASRASSPGAGASRSCCPPSCSRSGCSCGPRRGDAGVRPGAGGGPSTPPLLEVLRRHPRNLLLSIGIGFGAFVAQGVLTTFVIAYAVQAGFARQTVLNALTVSSIAAVFGIVGFAALSDRVGRRPVVLVGALAMTVWAFVLFPLVDSGSTGLLVLGVVVGQGVVHAAMYGPLAALYTELFSTRSRYTGASLGYQIAGIGAGLGPVVFATVLQTSGSALWVSVVIAACCVITVICVALAGETSGQSLDAHDVDADHQARTPVA